MSEKLVVGITTYEARYYPYFRSLAASIGEVFDDIDVIVAVNGSRESEIQRRYIKQLVKGYGGKKKFHFIIHSDVVGLSRMWNEIVGYSHARNILILNDDVAFDPWFRVRLEEAVANNLSLTTINGSWSHFILNIDCYKNVGPFDEGFVGIGFEDIDYCVRMHQKNVDVRNIVCQEIYDLNDNPTQTSYDQMSNRVWEKFTESNRKHFMTKYKVLSCDNVKVSENAKFVKQFGQYVIPRTDYCSEQESADIQLPSHRDKELSQFVPMDYEAGKILEQCEIDECPASTRRSTTLANG